MTKQLLQWRGILMGLAIFFTMVPLSFGFENGRLVWTFRDEVLPLAIALVCLGGTELLDWLSGCSGAAAGLAKRTGGRSGYQAKIHLARRS